MKFEKNTFENMQVILDDNEYVGCTFKSCTFVYAGVGYFNLRDNHITGDTHISFSGNAANTLAFMQAVYRDFGDWGRQAILKAFQQIAPDLKKMN